MNSILTLIIIINQLIFPSTALNQIGCLIDEDYCEPYEFCLNDSLLGICVSMDTSPKSLRSEEEIDTPLLNTPIRIHKYSQELDDYIDDYWQKRAVDSMEEDRMLMPDPLSLFINLSKRPTIISYPEDEEEQYEYDYDQEPASIEHLLRLLASRQDYRSDQDYGYDQTLSLQKRDLSEQSDYESMLEQMFYESKEREPRLIRWLYFNRLSSVPDQEEYEREPKMTSRLKSILKENIMIEQIFNGLIKTTSQQAQIDMAKHEKTVGENEVAKEEAAKEMVKEKAKLFSANDMDLYAENGQYDIIDASFIFLELDKKINESEAKKFVEEMAWITSSQVDSLTDLKIDDRLLVFKVQAPTDPDQLLKKIVKHQLDLGEKSGVKIVSCGLGKQNHRYVVEGKHPLHIDTRGHSFAILTSIVCALTAAVLVMLAAIFCYKRKEYLTQKLIADVGYSKSDDAEQLVEAEKRSACCSLLSMFRSKPKSADSELKEPLPRQDYQELCRQRMHNKNPACTTMNESASQISMNSPNFKSESSRSSTSSWSEEPLSSFNIDITTGHVILSYMEQHLNDKNRLNKDWDYLSSYTAEPNKTEAGTIADNMTKNRYSNILPYDHTRVKLMDNKENDYINANFIIDDDPKNAAYIATQGPLIHTSGDFWQMVWEQKSVVIVSLCRTVEYGSLKCNQYWPSNGYEVFDKFEIHLVSEHVWCEDYLVRNFFLKNLDNNQTRTITQFHFLTWPENGTPQSIKSLLDFRRKVNKSFKSKSSPLIVHCNDGIGRTGTYVLIDMILNKIQRGAKEIDLAATLEFLRDQRPGIVKNKAQFEFSFAVVIEEIQNMLKALTQ